MTVTFILVFALAMLSFVVLAMRSEARPSGMQWALATFASAIAGSVFSQVPALLLAVA